MPVIKIRLKINKPGNQVSIPKILSVLGSFNAYLGSLGSDLGIGDTETWQMADATQRNQKDAIAFNILSSGHYKQEEVDFFSTALSWPKLDLDGVEKFNIGRKTVENFAKLVDNFEESDKVFIGTYKKSAQHPSSWTIVNKDLINKISRMPIEKIEFYGDIQGVIKSFAKERKKNKCKIQELIFNSVVDCEFDDDIYKDVVHLLERRDAIVKAYGPCTATRHNGRIYKMSIEKITESPRYKKGDIEGIRGCLPDLPQSYSSENLPKWLTNG